MEARAEADLPRVQMHQQGCTCEGNDYQVISDRLCKLLSHIKYKENLEKKERRHARQPPP